MDDSRQSEYRGFSINVRAASDGRTYVAGYVIGSPAGDTLYRFLPEGFATLEAALDGAITKARSTVDLMADNDKALGDP